jgi:hypothetical protein
MSSVRRPATPTAKAVRLLRYLHDEDRAAASLLVPARVPVAGVNLREKGVNAYRCPVCGRVFRHDDEYEPMCTGPGATDDHPMTVMVFEAVTPPIR